VTLTAAVRLPGSQDVVELLLAAGADPSLPAEGGATPLHAAAANGSLSTVLALLQARWSSTCYFAFTALEPSNTCGITT
jgi:ankyrin repeat protein